MHLITTNESAWTPLAPEIVICVVGLVVLALELLVHEEKRTVLVWVSLFGLVGALGACGAVLNQVNMGFEALRLPLWLEGTMRVDEFALVLKMLVLFATLLTVLASCEYAHKWFTTGEGEYYAFLVFVALGMMLMVGASDLISIYVAMEFTSITSYILVAYRKRDPQAAEAGIKYYLIGVVSSAVMLYGMSLIYGYTGSTNLAGIGRVLSAEPAEPVLVLALIMFLAGLGFKLAAAPFHMWAPEAYVGGPTPFVGLLSVGPKAAGVGVLIRVLEIAFPDLRANWTVLIGALAAVSMLLGNLAAIAQTNIKRMLAYSSIGQIGYILIGIAAGFTPASSWCMTGILLYLTAYLFMNVGAFAIVTVVYNATCSDEIEDYDGLMHRAPLAAVALTVFLASLAGIPPTAGFWGKLYVFGAAIHSGLPWMVGLAVIGVVCSVISVYYYFNIVRTMFFPRKSEHGPVGMPLHMSVAVVIALIGALCLGLYPEPFIEMTRGGLSLLVSQ